MGSGRELPSNFPTCVYEHGFLFKDYIRDHTKLQEGRYVHPEQSLDKAIIDSSSYGYIISTGASTHRVRVSNN